MWNFISKIQVMARWWRYHTTGSTFRKIFGAASIVTFLTALVYTVSVCKELVVAWQFGTGDALDAFLIAFLVPSFAINVIAGSFNSALIPTYIRVREQEGTVATQRLFSSIMLCSTGLLAIAILFTVLLSPLYLPLFASGFGFEKLILTQRLLYVLAPIIMFSGLVTIWGAILNAGERFALAALSPIITPIVVVIFLLFGGGAWGIFALAVGTLFGIAIETALLGTALKRHGISLRLSWYGFDTHLRTVAGQYAPMIVGVFLMSGTNLVDQAMAAMLEPGSVAALNYGGKVVALPLGLAVTGLGTAALPYFSIMLAREAWQELQYALERYLWLIFIVTVPITGLLFLFSEPLIRTLFQRGMFCVGDTHVVASIQALYALQIPFYVGGILVVRMISSIRANHILMWVAAINLTVNVLLNYLFMKTIGVAGIALATSCVYLISFSFLLYSWRRLRKGQ